MLEPRSLRDYWIKVLAFELAILALFIGLGLGEASQWFNLLPIALAIGQAILVYRMLRQTGRSTGAILLFFLIVRVGPSLEFGNREVHLVALFITLLPIIYAGWPIGRSSNTIDGQAAA